MRQAAAAAFVSLGGLYFYFPNKQALVLFGMDGEVLGAACAEFRTQTRNLLESDPPSAAEALIRFFAESASFIRPALLAALELGADEFMSRLETFLSIGIEDFVETLRLAVDRLRQNTSTRERGEVNQGWAVGDGGVVPRGLGDGTA